MITISEQEHFAERPHLPPIVFDNQAFSKDKQYDHFDENTSFS